MPVREELASRFPGLGLKFQSCESEPAAFAAASGKTRKILYEHLNGIRMSRSYVFASVCVCGEGGGVTVQKNLFICV